MNCRKCLHFMVCTYNDKSGKAFDCSQAENCPSFRNRDNFIELPCKVGDTIWEVWSSGSDCTQIQRGVRAIKVDLIYINQYDTTFHCISEEMTGHIPLSDFGKTVFLTPEEANKKLKELGQ